MFRASFHAAERSIGGGRLGLQLAISGWIVLGKIFCADGSPSAQNASHLALYRGEAVYRIYCAACHGDSGDGTGPAAAAMSPAPRDFTIGLYKYRSTPSGSLPTDEDLRKVVNMGVPGTWMPGWRELLSERQIEDVIAYIKTFLRDDRSWEEAEPMSSLDERPPQPDDQMLRDGMGLYLLLQCWTCHGFNGRGKGPAARMLKDAKGKSLKPANLTQSDYRAGFSPEEIRKTFLTGLSGTPMPSYDGVFLVAREDVEEEVVSKNLPSKVAQDFHYFIASLPTLEELGQLTENERAVITMRNEWALVHYVRSLAEKKSWLDRLLRINPESKSVGAKP